ncbi:hypothetical protein [Arcobacter sp.]|uniref:hypothetical protein n=1 Tax=Arcobacter sp. TaxID=1872629 RepID=UPI003D13F093
MDLFELKNKLRIELDNGQTIENLVEYVICDFDKTNTIITKHYAQSINIRHSTKKRLIREFILEL